MDDTIHPISDLVGSFLEAAQTVVSSSDPSISLARPAELTYELDQVVSNYLDLHQLSPGHYDSIQQDVVNTIAHHLGDEGVDDGTAVPLDEHGNAGLTDVISLIDHHFSSSEVLLHDSLVDASAFSADIANNGVLG